MDKELEARVAVLEYRADNTDDEIKKLAIDWADSHKALKDALVGIQNNLTAIKWAVIGALIASTISIAGVGEGMGLLKSLFF